MTSHFGVMVLFAAFVSLVFSVIAKDRPVDQARFGLRMLAGFVAAGLVAGWLMLALPL